MSAKPPHQPDETVVLGLLPDELPHTHGPRVAHPRPGFIAPTATAGGDAPPIHDTNHAAAPDRISAHPGANRSHASFVANHRWPMPYGGSDTLDGPTLTGRRSAAVAVARALTPAVLAILGFVAVWVATVVYGTAGTPVGTAALMAAAGCGLLLVVAQLISRRPPR